MCCLIMESLGGRQQVKGDSLGLIFRYNWAASWRCWAYVGAAPGSPYSLFITSSMCPLREQLEQSIVSRAAPPLIDAIH